MIFFLLILRMLINKNTSFICSLECIELSFTTNRLTFNNMGVIYQFSEFPVDSRFTLQRVIIRSSDVLDYIIYHYPLLRIKTVNITFKLDDLSLLTLLNFDTVFLSQPIPYNEGVDLCKFLFDTKQVPNNIVTKSEFTKISLKKIN
jgi:hypothetical protein